MNVRPCWYQTGRVVALVVIGRKLLSMAGTVTTISEAAQDDAVASAVPN